MTDQFLARRARKLCQSCKAQPVSKRRDSIFCDDCANRIGREREETEGNALFDRIQRNNDPEGYWSRARRQA